MTYTKDQLCWDKLGFAYLHVCNLEELAYFFLGEGVTKKTLSLCKK